MTAHTYADTAALTGRSLRHIARSPDTIVTTAITPIAMMLLFVYVFGGAIDTGPSAEPYVTYLLPGILLITIASGIAYTAYRLFMDMDSGIVERFQSMPIARSAVLWAHVLTSLVANLISLAVVIAVALIMGFRSGAGVGARSVLGPAGGFAPGRDREREDFGALGSRLPDTAWFWVGANALVGPVLGVTALVWALRTLQPGLAQTFTAVAALISIPVAHWLEGHEQPASYWVGASVSAAGFVGLVISFS